MEHLGSYIPGGSIGAVGCYLGLSSANRAEKLQSPLQAKATRQTFHVSCHERIGKGLRSYRPTSVHLMGLTVWDLRFTWAPLPNLAYGGYLHSGSSYMLTSWRLIYTE